MALMFKKIVQPFIFLGMMSVLLGGGYPASIYWANHYLGWFFHDGSLNLAGQSFSDPASFWGRPNIEEKKNRMNNYNKAQKKHNLSCMDTMLQFPVDFITASASGVDPHISIASALIQIERVSKETGKSREILENYVQLATEKRQFGFMGYPRVNVAKLNVLISENKPGLNNG